jgi:DNA polymerase-3 subunit epsilon
MSSSWSDRLAVFDLETTGVDVETARIVSACVAVLDAAGAVIARWDWLADPGIPIPDGAAAVHGISTERARADGRPAAQVVAEIAQTLRVLFDTGSPLVVYNAPYDLSLLDRETRRYGLPPLSVPEAVIDPLVIDKALDRYRKGKRTLEAAAAFYGVSLDDAHDAGSDAIAAGRVAQAQVARFADDLGIEIADLHGRQRSWCAAQAASFQDYMRSRRGEPDFVAPSEWPVRVLVGGGMLDTQPLPAPERRLTVVGVPMFELPAQPAVESPQTPPESAPAAPVAREKVVELMLDLGDEAEAPRSGHAAHPVIGEVIPAEDHGRHPTVLRVAAGIVTDAEGRTLLVRKRDSTAFMQAGGKIEPGESALDALIRELREEIGIDVDLDATEYLGSYRAVAANEADTVIRAEVFAVTTGQEAVASNEIEELLWLDAAEGNAVELAPLTRDTILPLWSERRATLF